MNGDATFNQGHTVTIQRPAEKMNSIYMRVKKIFCCSI